MLGNCCLRTPIRRAILFIAAAVAACAPATAPPAGGAPTPAARRIEVLFLGQHQQLHNADRFAPMLQAALAPEGINFTYSTHPNDLNPTTLQQYDALLLYANYDTITPGQERALLDFVASGRGFLPIHSASHCFRNSAAYVALVGAQFKSHGGEEFAAEFVQPEHPILEGIRPFRVWDETYVHEKHNPDRTVLLERVDRAGREPWAWTRTHGKGRVFYTAYGHGEQTWSHPSFHRLLRNAIRWAVGPEVQQQLERLALQPLRYADAPVPVPNYEKRDPAPRFQEPLAPDEALNHFQVPPGFEVRLFAAEPDIVNPLAMTWDERGRLWVVESVDYPNNKQPLGQGNDAIKILEDTDGDGRADRVTVFADRLSIPTSLVLVNGGAVVAQAPEFLFLKDTTGDDRADVREVIMTGWSVEDTHAGPSNLKYGFDNWLWGALGYAGFRGTIGGDSVRMSAGLYRFAADGSQLQPLTRFTNNTWGLGFSEAFDVFGSTANDEHSTYMAIPLRAYADVKGLRGDGRKKIDGHYAVHPNTAKIRQVDVQGGFTAVAGHNLYTARSFPSEYWNRIAFVNEPTAHVVHRAILRRDGAGYAEADGWNLLASDDEWFAPIQSEVGPDGAVWVLDWYHFIVQHNPTPEGFKEGKGNAYETPLRDSRRGRVYRVVWQGAPPYHPLSLRKDRPKELVAALRHDNLFWRLTAQRLLVERGQTDVLPELYALAGDRSVDAVGLNTPVVHALWTLHGLGAISDPKARGAELARRALTHPSAAVRRNALMMLPRTEATRHDVLQGGLLKDPDLNVRMIAFLTLAELPASKVAGRAIYEISTDSIVSADEWLSEAVFIAATRHADGFLAAYAEDIGMAEFLRLAMRVSRGEVERFTDQSRAGRRRELSPVVPIAQQFLVRTNPLEQFLQAAAPAPAAAGPAAAGGTTSGRDLPLVLRHRYSFDETPGSARVADAVGGRHGMLLGNGQFANGQLVLPGGAGNSDGGYVALPGAMISKLPDAVTFEAWVTWNGGPPFQRVFDFGTNSEGTGTTYIFLTPQAGRPPNAVYAAYTLNSWSEEAPALNGTAPLPEGKQAHVALAYDAKARVARLYVDGKLVDTQPVAQPLSRLTDENNWLGRSNWAPDPRFNGSLSEFRIYEGAMTDADAAVSFQRGPQAAPGTNAAAPTTPAAARVTGRRAARAPIKIGVAREGMRFDMSMITVKAGQPVQIVFTNTAPDVPHNLVLFDRISAAEVDRLLAAAMKDPETPARGFVPDAKAVLQATPLLPPGQSATLSFTAPTAPGNYQYVCSVPGHSPTMRGTLRVEQ